MEVDNLDFAALSINATTSKDSDCMCQGWGSEETRKAYVCLQKLESDIHKAQQMSSIGGYQFGSGTNSTQTYSYLSGSDLDMDCDENFW